MDAVTPARRTSSSMLLRRLPLPGPGGGFRWELWVPARSFLWSTSCYSSCLLSLLSTTSTLRHEVFLPWPTTWTRGGVEGFLKDISGYVIISFESGDIVQDGPGCTCVKGVCASESLFCPLCSFGVFLSRAGGTRSRASFGLPRRPLSCSGGTGERSEQDRFMTHVHKGFSSQAYITTWSRNSSEVFSNRRHR